MKNVFQLSRYTGYLVLLMGIINMVMWTYTLMDIPLEFHWSTALGVALYIIELHFWVTLCRQCQKGAKLFIPALLITICMASAIINNLLFLLFGPTPTIGTLSSIGSLIYEIGILVGMMWLSRFFAKGSPIRLITIIAAFTPIIGAICSILILNCIPGAENDAARDTIIACRKYFNLCSSILDTGLWVAFYLLFSSANKKQS